ncbi:cadherin-like domain-containing protein, partial [candidate division KSB1 bacterium]|nr:cadherin-like domain-containing protein [candidate division KSB1 bacterium]
MKSLSCIFLQLLVVLSLSIGHTPVAAQTTLRPNAVDDAFFTDPGTLVTMPVLANDSDLQGLPLTVVAISAPGNGTATFNNTTVFYTPNSGFSGIDSLTYTVSNGVLTNTANVDAIVLPQPDLIWENDTFDPLNVGALAGQSGWTAVSGGASPLVIDDTPPNKSVRIDAVPGLPINVTKDVADQTGGRHSFTFRVRVDGATHIPCEAAIEVQTDFSNGWSNKFRYCIGPRIAVNFNSSGAETTIVATTVPGQWYLIHTELNLNTNLIDVYIDGVLKVSGLAVNTGPIRSLGITGQDPGGAGVVVVDNLTGVTANGITAGGGCGSGSGTPGMPNYWTGSGDSLWSNANNWSARRVPTATDHAIITLGGTYTVIVNSPVTVGSLTLGAGSGVQTLWVRNTTLTVNNDVRNSGIIRLQSTVNASSNLVILNGLLTNNRVINVGLGGFTGTINGQVCNRCRVDVHQDLTFIGTFYNRSIVDIDTTKRMSLSGSAQVFNQNGGEVTGKGVLALSNGATMNFNRGSTTGPNPPLLTNAKLNFGPAATGVATFIMDANGELNGNIGAEQTVWIRNTSNTITAPSGFTNAGVIRFQTTVNTFSALTIASGTLTNTGVINVNAA